MLFGDSSGPPHTIISSILSSGLAVYLAAINIGNFVIRDLVVEAGLLCPKCRTADCVKYHGTWYRKLIHDLCSGEVFNSVPILRVVFCDGSTKSLHPAELWRGKATITSTLEVSSIAAKDGLDEALQWVILSGGGDEVISERTLRRWLKRTLDRVSIASAILSFFPLTNEPASEKLENFLTQLHCRDLLTLRRHWGFSFLDLPPPEKPTNTIKCPKPGFHNPRPAQNPPSEILPRGTKCFPYRRGPPLDE